MRELDERVACPPTPRETLPAEWPDSLMAMSLVPISLPAHRNENQRGIWKRGNAWIPHWPVNVLRRHPLTSFGEV